MSFYYLFGSYTTMERKKKMNGSISMFLEKNSFLNEIPKRN